MSSLGMWSLPSIDQPPTSSLTATPEAILPASYMKEPGHHAEPPPQGGQHPSSSRQNSRHCTCRTRAWCGYLSGTLDWTSPGSPRGLQRSSQGSMPGTFAGTLWRPAGRGSGAGGWTLRSHGALPATGAASLARLHRRGNPSPCPEETRDVSSELLVKNRWDPGRAARW